MSLNNDGKQIYILEKLLNGFLLDRQIRVSSPRTITYYKNELNQFIRSIKIRNIDELKPDIIRQYLVDLQKTRNLYSINNAYRAIRAFLNWYEKEFEPENWQNPIRKVEVADPPTNALPGIELSDVHRMVDACKGPNSKRDKAILLTLLDTGARATELISISMEDIDLVTGDIIIRHGKGGKLRSVFLGSRARKAVRAYIKTRDYLRSNSPLFVTDDGDRLAYIGLYKIIQRRAADAGVDPTPGCHDFRRAFALAMLRNGCDLERLARLMGHSNLEILRRYLALVNKDLSDIHGKTSPADNWD
jgi:site-specific recombinase XerD